MQYIPLGEAEIFASVYISVLHVPWGLQIHLSRHAFR